MVTFSNIINEIDENPLSIERANEGNSFTGPEGRDADTLGGNYQLIMYLNRPLII